ncbi:hypothetical protein C2S52_003916 [Perilla frutescens var. hirtella]|nr:hypothetical protein C2S51_011628 [Perilla frutescens var. frutescens]KAH6793439.1 hypothetical protein C2S52_003916 [Perilla frutescens var. hirtella]
MEHPFFTTPATARSEALRWLTISEKLLAAQDLLGSKSFAARAHDSDPTLSEADEILAIVDTLLAGERRIVNNQPDWYAVLHLTPLQGREAGLISGQYRRLAFLLNPQTNRFPFAEQAFRLIFDAYSVLSNPPRRSFYDRELVFYSQPPPPPPPLQQQELLPNPFSAPIPASSQNFVYFGGGGGVAQQLVHGGQSGGVGGSHSAQVDQVHVQPQVEVEPVVGGSTRQPQNFMGFSSGFNFVFGSGSSSKSGYETVSNPEQESYSNFGVGADVVSASETTQEQFNNIQKQSLHNFSNVYVDCTLKCQNCKKAFQAVVIPSPPPIVEGQDSYFCCWGFLPFGFSMEEWKKHNAGSSGWTPFSPMFSCPQTGNNVNEGVGGARGLPPKVNVDNNEVNYVVISDSSESDEDRQGAVTDKYKKKKAKNVEGKKAVGTPGRHATKAHVDKGVAANIQDGIVPPQGAELPKKPTNELSKMGLAANAEKQPGCGKLDLNVELSIETEEPAIRTNQSGRGEDDNIEGNGFFEGLEEYLSSLPILNAVGDDKVVKAAS